MQCVPPLQEPSEKLPSSILSWAISELKDHLGIIFEIFSTNLSWCYHSNEKQLHNMELRWCEFEQRVREKIHGDENKNEPNQIGNGVSSSKKFYQTSFELPFLMVWRCFPCHWHVVKQPVHYTRVLNVHVRCGLFYFIFVHNLCTWCYSQTNEVVMH